MIGMLVAEETPQIAQILQKAVQEIKRLNPHARVEFVDYNDYYINKENEQNLKELIAKHRRGELKYCTLDDIIAETDAIIEGKNLR